MFHLALDGPFIFCNIMHCYKRDYLHVVAKLLSHQHSLDRGKLSDTCASWNRRSPRTEGKPASEQLGCLGTARVKPATHHNRYCGKPDRKVIKISYYRDEAVQISRWGTVAHIRQIEENLLSMINCGKRKKSYY